MLFINWMCNFNHFLYIFMYCIDDFSCKKSRLLFVCISCSNHFIKPCLQTTVSQSSLFEHLINIWEFNPGPVPGTCDLYFHVDFKFQSPLYRQVFLWHLMCGYGLWFFFLHLKLVPMSKAFLFYIYLFFTNFITQTFELAQMALMFFKEVVSRLVSSFTDRCRRVYGPGVAVLEDWRRQWRIIAQPSLSLSPYLFLFNFQKEKTDSGCFSKTSISIRIQEGYTRNRIFELYNTLTSMHSGMISFLFYQIQLSTRKTLVYCCSWILIQKTKNLLLNLIDSVLIETII